MSYVNEKTYKDLENFNNWSDADKDQLSIAVIKGLIMDATREANSGHRRPYVIS